MHPAPPTLHTRSGLVLEPLREAHAHAMWPLLREPALYTHLDDAPPESPAALQARYRRWAQHQWPRPSPHADEGWLNWIITEQGQPIGFAQATLLLPTRIAEVAYILGTAHQGRGRARAAMQAVVDHLHAAHGCTLLRATVEAANAPSIRLLRALGFEEARAPQHPASQGGPIGPACPSTLTRSATERLYVRAAPAPTCSAPAKGWTGKPPPAVTP